MLKKLKLFCLLYLYFVCKLILRVIFLKKIFNSNISNYI